MTTPRHIRWTDRIPKIAGIITASVTIALSAGWLVNKIWLTDVVCQVVEARACSPARVDTLIHDHLNPVLDSLTAMNRRVLKYQIYQQCQTEIIMGPDKAALAEKKYLSMIKAMGW